MKKSILFTLAVLFFVLISPINKISRGAASPMAAGYAAEGAEAASLPTAGATRTAKANGYKSQGYVFNTVIYLSFAESKVDTADDENAASAENAPSIEKAPSAENTCFGKFDKDFFAKMERMYNSPSSLSVKNYYLKQSNGKLTVETTFFGENEPIKLDHTVEYYKPKYVWKDGEYELTGATEGYDNRRYNENGECVSPMTENAKESIDGYLREQMLIREVIAKCDIGNYWGDYDGDGKLDSVVFVTDAGKNGNSDSSWGEILWSHMGVAHNFSQSLLKNYYCTEAELELANSLVEPRFGYSEISKYNFLSAGEICKNKVSDFTSVLKGTGDEELYDVGLLCHEMAHNLGLYDYYSYEDPKYESVGEFDVLGNYTPVPQNMLAYVRYKMGWLSYDNILYVNSSGQFSLPFSWKDGYVCAKIVLSNYLTTGEYFILEARSKDYATKDDPYDSCLSGSGLIIYRVAEKNAYINSKGTIGNTEYGNMYGADEVYVYRIPARDGSVNKLTQKNLLLSYSTALLGTALSSTGVTRFGASQYIDGSTMIDYSDGANSLIVVKDIAENGEKSSVKGMSFTVSLPDDLKAPAITMSISQCMMKDFYDGSKRLLWSSNINDGKAYVIALRSTDRLKRLAETNKANITIEDIKKGSYSYYKTLYAASLPIAEKQLTLPEFEDSAMIFLALESSSGLRSIRYVGEIEAQNQSFSQMLARIFDPMYTFAVIAVLLIGILVAVLIFTGKHTLKSSDWRRRR